MGGIVVGILFAPRGESADEQKLIPGALQCTGNRYFLPYNHVSRESSKEALINEDYEFVAYTSLKGLVHRILLDCCKMTHGDFVKLMEMDVKKMNEKEKKDKEVA